MKNTNQKIAYDERLENIVVAFADNGMEEQEIMLPIYQCISEILSHGMESAESRSA